MVALAVPMGVGRFAFTPILPMMQVDAGLSIAAGAWLASANYLGTLIGALAATAVRVPIQPAVRGGLVTIGLATLAMGLERRVPAWIVLRLIAGIATGWVLPFASAWALERLAPLRRPLLNAAVFAGFGVGIAAAGGVCIVLMHGRASSAQAWLSLGLVSLAATAVVWRSFVGRDVRSEASRRTGTGRWDTDAMLLVGPFPVITMAGFQEGREVGGGRMIAAMASAFAVGQVGGPVLVRSMRFARTAVSPRRS